MNKGLLYIERIFEYMLRYKYINAFFVENDNDYLLEGIAKYQRKLADKTMYYFQGIDRTKLSGEIEYLNSHVEDAFRAALVYLSKEDGIEEDFEEMINLFTKKHIISVDDSEIDVVMCLANIDRNLVHIDFIKSIHSLLMCSPKDLCNMLPEMEE